MNMFNAVNEVRKSTVMTKHNNEWHFTVNGKVFAVISKSCSKYFVHTEGRTTTLPCVDHFMKAIAIVAKQYLAIVNHPAIKGREIFHAYGVMVVIGTDFKLYSKSYTDKSTFILCNEDLHTHIRQCYGTILPWNISPEYVADTIINVLYDIA